MCEGPCRVFTDMELLILGLETIGDTILELIKINHDSSVHKTHIAHRVVLLGIGFAQLKIVCARRSSYGVYRHGTFNSRVRKQLLYHVEVEEDNS